MRSALPDDPARWRTIKGLFEEALALPAAERDAFLDEACLDDAGTPDADLRDAVEELLAADTEAEAFLDETPSTFAPLFGALSASVAAAGAAVPEGQVIGPYRVLRRLGAGGMGEVFLAERADGLFERRVAVKRVRTGLEHAAIAARFEAERRILAGLQHPGIARLLDAGTDADGRPFFAMDYVEGAPLTRYVRERTLGLGGRLDLVLQVCEAVHHAHQHLVVHRDLKPSNVLVTEDVPDPRSDPDGDARPRPVLLDFGIARLLDDENEAVTETGLRPMTRAYAAPEQIRGEPATTATDVYALGVLLYELLTDRRPFEAPTPSQLEAAILTQAPTRPSRLPPAPEAVAPRRLRGDLDTIVLKALHKDPAGRYASAAALADDLRRFRDGLPIQARPPSVGYRLRLFVRRNPIGVTAAAALALVLLTFSTLLALQQRATARERDTAEATARFLATLFESADPAVSQGNTLTAHDLLDFGLDRLDTDLADAPLVQADLLDVMSRAFLRLDDADRAREVAHQAVALRRRLGTDDGALAHSLVRLAEAEAALVRNEAADRHYREATALLRRRGDAPALIEALQQYGWFLTSATHSPDSIEAVYDEVLALRRAHYGPDDPGLGLALHQLATAQHLTGDYARADSLHRLAIASFRQHAEHPAELADALHKIGVVLRYRHRYSAADSFLTESLALHERVYGPEHSTTAEVLADLGSTRLGQQRFPEAEALLDSALARYTRVDGPRSVGVRQTLGRLRRLYASTGRPGEALAAGTRLYALSHEHYDQDDPIFAGISAQYSSALADAGHYAEAEAHLRREALPLQAAAFGATSAMYGNSLRNLARYVEAQGRPREAEALYEETYAILATQLPPSSGSRARVAYALGRLRASRGAHDEALPLFREAVAGYEAREYPPELAGRARHGLGTSLLALGRFEEAGRLLEQAHAALASSLGPDHADTRAAAEALDRCRRHLKSSA